jgi:mRNA interferase HigB
MKGANWRNTNDIFGNAAKRVMFDIGGNKFRCICDYSFGDKFVRLFVNWIGTHAKYSKICDNNNQYTISIY